MLLLRSCGTSHLAQNHDVVIIDNLATGRRENIEHLLGHPRVTFIEGSITDLDLLMEARWAEGPEREHR